MLKQLSPLQVSRRARGSRHLSAQSVFFCSGKSANVAAPALQIGRGNTSVVRWPAFRPTHTGFVPRGVNSSKGPNPILFV
jgi:hypothetical protein